jgi:stage III sporulation protein SpoIIIAA
MLVCQEQKHVVRIYMGFHAAGDADLPHKALGAARRVAVPQRQQQGDVMLQAARNHCVDVMIVDEIATAEVTVSACLTLGGLQQPRTLVAGVGG